MVATRRQGTGDDRIHAACLETAGAGTFEPRGGAENQAMTAHVQRADGFFEPRKYTVCSVQFHPASRPVEGSPEQEAAIRSTNR